MKPKLPKKAPSITITFETPLHGYWNGGKKGGGTFHPTPESDGMINWGCWELNIWYRLPFGKDWKDAAVRARNKIKRNCKVNCKTEVIWG
jgi:hypothetical protein